MNTSVLLILAPVPIYLLLWGAALYLLIVTRDARRWFMLLFLVSYSLLIAGDICAAFDIAKYDDIKEFSYWISHCASGAFIALLAVDRVLFKKGFMIRSQKNKKARGIDCGNTSRGT